MSKKKGAKESPLASNTRVSLPIHSIQEAALDTLFVKILSLRIPDEPSKRFSVKVTYYDQLIFMDFIKSISPEDPDPKRPVISGSMCFDPSDYEKMCLYADYPLIVNIQPLRSIRTSTDTESHVEQSSKSDSDKLSSSPKQPLDISCCNVDILPIFLDKDKPKLLVKKRMEPLIKPSALQLKSWERLPLLTMEISVNRHEDNAEYHNVLQKANWMKITLVGSYNMITPYDSEYVYTAASKLPLYSETNTGLAMFNQGTEAKKFSSTSLFPTWESLRVGGDLFTKGDDKLTYTVEDIQNDDSIDVKHYISKSCEKDAVVWASFHRSLLINRSSEQWLKDNILEYKWPLEIHIYGEDGGYSFMAFLNLFRLLYAGEKRVILAVPLRWVNPVDMSNACGCKLLLTPNDQVPSSDATMMKTSRLAIEASESTEAICAGFNTGADENAAFVIVEVKLARPLVKVVVPTPLPRGSLGNMLKEIEESGNTKRHCSGRGQLAKDWQSIVKVAATSLRRVPYYASVSKAIILNTMTGITEFCAFSRQLSETRTRVEVTTSCWQEAAIYVNNNFVVQQYLHSDEIFEEMVMMTHACLVRLACDSLLGTSEYKKETTDPVLKSARQARQMQDTEHAMELYMQVVDNRPADANYWRELSTCLKDIDRDWANVCLNTSMVMDPRSPLTLVSKAGMVFESDPADAEIFLVALLAHYPFWTTAWIISSAYHFERQNFLMADKILDIVNRNRREGVTEELGYARSWERELGDWWDTTPILPGMDYYYDAADLLLRLRCFSLAEVCVARALTRSGETSVYYHLVALCCRLRGEYREALCHLNNGLEKFGEVNYLRSLEGECLHKMCDLPASLASYEKVGTSGGAFTILMSIPVYKDSQRCRPILVDLVRRQPSAYSWMALANDWMKLAGIIQKAGQKGGEMGDMNRSEELTTAKACATASAVQALKWDRRAGCAWALLANLVKPSARRMHCMKMATLCGYKMDKHSLVKDEKSQPCYRLGFVLTDCNCNMCQNVRL